MIKIALSKGKEEPISTVILGLSRQNCEQILRGHPIRIHGAQLGLNVDSVLILGGETEDDIREELRTFKIQIPDSDVPA